VAYRYQDKPYYKYPQQRDGICSLRTVTYSSEDKAIIFRAQCLWSFRFPPPMLVSVNTVYVQKYYTLKIHYKFQPFDHHQMLVYIPLIHLFFPYISQCLHMSVFYVFGHLR
jgi:hypothetical protein